MRGAHPARLPLLALGRLHLITIYEAILRILMVPSLVSVTVQAKWGCWVGASRVAGLRKARFWVCWSRRLGALQARFWTTIPKFSKRFCVLCIRFSQNDAKRCGPRDGLLPSRHHRTPTVGFFETSREHWSNRWFLFISTCFSSVHPTETI